MLSETVLIFVGHLIFTCSTFLPCFWIPKYLDHIHVYIASHKEILIPILQTLKLYELNLNSLSSHQNIANNILQSLNAKSEGRTYDRVVHLVAYKNDYYFAICSQKKSVEIFNPKETIFEQGATRATDTNTSGQIDFEQIFPQFYEIEEDSQFLLYISPFYSPNQDNQIQTHDQTNQ